MLPVVVIAAGIAVWPFALGGSAELLHQDGAARAELAQLHRDRQRTAPALAGGFISFAAPRPSAKRRITALRRRARVRERQHGQRQLTSIRIPAEAPPDETLLTKLANDELVQLDDWALEQGLTTPDGRANRAAAVRALIHQYIMDEPGAEESRDDDDSLLHHADWPDEVDSLEDSSGGVCIHLLCHNDYGVTEHVDGTFDTRAWRVGERWLRQGTRVAMHAFMTEPSYRQGWLVSYRRDTKRLTRFVLTVQAGGESVEWPDPPYGQNPVRIRRS